MFDKAIYVLELFILFIIMYHQENIVSNALNLFAFLHQMYF